MFFKGKEQEEEGYILHVRKNALQILIPKYGLECTLFLAPKGDTSTIFTYDEEEQTQRAGDVVLHAFDPVTVRLALDSNNIQHEKFVLQLLKPYIEGFSVVGGRDEVSSNKRKSTAKETKQTKRKSKN